METFKYGNGVWATKTGSSLAYNDENDNYKPLPFSVTRDSIATRVNKQGLIEVVGRDKLRIDYTDSSKGVALLEPARTNYVTYSNDASQWSDVISNGTVTKTADYAISPDGTQNATRLEASVSGSGYALISSAVTTAFSGNYTATVYVKSNTDNNQDIVFYGRNTDFDKHTVTGEWTRIQFKGSSTSGQTNYAYIGISTGIRAEDNPIDILVWGGQLESGSYSTSLIPTSGSTVTREADVANGAGNSEVFNDSEGVLFADIAALADDGTSRRIAVSDESYSNRAMIELDENSNKLNYFVFSGGVNQNINVDFILSNSTLYNKIAAKYKVNDFALWVNGFEVDFSTSGNTPTGLDELAFDDGGNTSKFYGKSKRIAYFDAVLTDAELEALTSYTSFTNMANELNLTIK
jgi:hypothetical protein